MVDIRIYVVQRVYLLNGLVATDTVGLPSRRIQKGWMVGGIVACGGVIVCAATAIPRVAAGAVQVRLRGRDDVRDRLLYRGDGVCMGVVLGGGRSGDLFEDAQALEWLGVGVGVNTGADASAAAGVGVDVGVACISSGGIPAGAGAARGEGV